MRKITKRSLAITTAAVVAVGGGAAAWAAWSVSSSATATVSAGTAVPVSVTDAALSGPLLPGIPVAVTFKVSNSNPFKVVVKGASITNLKSADESKCPSENFVALSEAKLNPSTFTIEPGSKTLAATANGNLVAGIRLKTSPANGCQGVSATFTLNVNAESLDPEQKEAV